VVYIYIKTYKVIKMVVISANVSPEIYEYKKKNGLNWSSMIISGYRFNDEHIQVRILENRLADLEREFNEMEAQFKVRGMRLKRYIEKFGMDDDILYKQE
jgi:hypothetical protein